MGHSSGGFGGYRGRKSIHEILKLIAIVLGAVVAVVLVGLFLGQDYIVFTDRGLKLDLPFFQQEKPQSPDPGNVSVVIRPEEEAAPVQPPPVEEDAVAPPMLALALSLDTLLRGDGVEQLTQAGATAVVVEVKDAQGRLGWVSEQPLAQVGEINATGADINQRLQQLNEGELYTVARVCCFRDNTLPYHRNALALRASYGNWRDADKLRWLNPANEQAQAYLVGLCVELAQLGFDEILLECAAFPTAGALDKIVAPTTAPQQVVDGFLEQVQQALAPYDIALSLVVEAGTITGEDISSGLSAQSVENYATHLWMAAQSITAEQAQGAGITQWEQRLVGWSASTTEPFQIPRPIPTPSE